MLVYHKAPHRPWEPDEAHADMYSDPIPRAGDLHDDYADPHLSARRAQCGSPTTSTPAT